MTSPRTSEAGTARRADMRRAVLHLVIAVLALDAIALAIYYLGGVRTGSSHTQVIFTAVWAFSTAIVVAFLLRRVRLIRQGMRSR